MVVAPAKVRLLCTDAEAALVRSSRKPELEQLSKVEIKRLAVQARKLANKWRGLARGQSRDRKPTGSSELDKNTRLKSQIFLDAQEALEAELNKPAAAPIAITKPIPPSSKQRTSEHRQTRAAVRKGMAAAEDLMNMKKQPKKSPAAKKPTAKSTPAKPAPAKIPVLASVVIASPTVAAPKKHSPAASKPATKPAAKPAVHLPAAKLPAPHLPATTPAAPKKPPKAVVLTTSKKPPKAAGLSVSKQRAATTAAKKSRVVQSGKTTRMFAHASSRGKRTQARRDTKG